MLILTDIIRESIGGIGRITEGLLTRTIRISRVALGRCAVFIFYRSRYCQPKIKMSF